MGLYDSLLQKMINPWTRREGHLISSPSQRLTGRCSLLSRWLYKLCVASARRINNRQFISLYLSSTLIYPTDWLTDWDAGRFSQYSSEITGSALLMNESPAISRWVGYPLVLAAERQLVEQLCIVQKGKVVRLHAPWTPWKDAQRAWTPNGVMI